MSLGKLLINVGANIADFESDMGRAARIAQKRSESIKREITAATKAVAAGLGAAAAGTLLLVKNTANVGDQLDKMSRKLGVSVEFLSKYDYHSKLAGSSLETVGTAAKKLQKSINDADNGLSTAIRGFDALGLSVEDLKKLSPEKQFELVSKKLGELGDQSKLTGTAMDLFGRSGADLIPLFKTSQEEIEKNTKQLEDFGAVMSTAQSQQGAAFNDALTTLAKNAEGFSNILAGQLTPALTEIVNQFNDSTVRDSAGDWTILQSAVVGAYGGVLLFSSSFEIIGDALGAVGVKIAGFFKELSLEFKIYVQQLKSDIAGIKAALNLGGLDEFADSLIKLNDLKGELSTLEDTNAQFNLLNTVADKTSSIVDGATGSLFKLVGAIKKGNKDLKDSTEIIHKADNDVEDLGKTAGLTAKKLGELGKDFKAIADRFLTPLEKLEAQYHAEIAAIDEWLSAQENWDEAVIKAANLSNQLTEEFDKNVKAIEDNKKAIENQKTPYEQLIQSMKDEVYMLGLKGDALRGAEAAQFLATQGITVAREGLEEYLNKLSEYLLLLEQINQANSVPSFSQKLDGISGMISSLENMHNSFKDMGRDFGKGMESLANGFKGALEGLGSVLGKDLLSGKIGNALGVVGVVGQIASFIDSLSGGRLFGTDYQLESAQTNIDIGQSGASGTQSQTSVRQRSFFRGRQWQTLTEDMEAAGLAALNAFYDGLISGIDDLSRVFGIEVPQLITGAFEQNFDENGDLVSEFSTILGRMWNETLQQFQLRLASENFIAVSDLGLGGGSEVSAFAEMYRESAESLAEYAEFAVDAVGQIISGDALLGSFTQLANLVQDLNQSNETLLETHQRMIGSTNLFNEALDIMGISLITNQELFIRFATEITDAAGGLERASDLWQSYFNTFYDSQELIEQQLGNATNNRDNLLSGLGTRGLNEDNFRQIFESVLPNLSAEAIVQWLEAAEAIGIVIDLEGQLAEQRSELTDILANIAEQNAIEGLSDFAIAMRNIQQALDEQIATAIRLGATEKELSMIRNYADRQFQNTIRQYEQSAQALSDSIYGSVSENLINGIESQLNGIGEQISLLEQQQSAAQQAAQAAIQAYETQQAALENIVDFAESLLTGQFSPLNPAEQLAIAQSQFDAALASGDLAALPGLAQTLLGLSQTNHASGQANTDIFNQVYDALSGLGIGIGVAAPSAAVGVPAGLSALYEQQAQLNQQLADAQIASDAAATLLQQQRLFDMLTELAEAQNVSIQVLAERLGIPLDRLVGDLGIRLFDLNTSLNKPLQLDTSTIDNSGDTLVADAITSEGEETQEEIRNLRRDVQDLSAEIRNLAAHAVA